MCFIVLCTFDLFSCFPFLRRALYSYLFDLFACFLPVCYFFLFCSSGGASSNCDGVSRGNSNSKGGEGEVGCSGGDGDGMDNDGGGGNASGGEGSGGSDG